MIHDMLHVLYYLDPSGVCFIVHAVNCVSTEPRIHTRSHGKYWNLQLSINQALNVLETESWTSHL